MRTAFVLLIVPMSVDNCIYYVLSVVSTDMLQKSFIYNIHLYLKLQSSQDIGLCGVEKFYI
jgi:hypothetical protein